MAVARWGRKWGVERCKGGLGRTHKDAREMAVRVGEGAQGCMRYEEGTERLMKAA